LVLNLIVIITDEPNRSEIIDHNLHIARVGGGANRLARGVHGRDGAEAP
jgi:hypothetical protein